MREVRWRDAGASHSVHLVAERSADVRRLPRELDATVALERRRCQGARGAAEWAGRIQAHVTRAERLIEGRAQISVPEVSVAKVSIPEIAVAQISVTQVAVAEIPVTEISVTQITVAGIQRKTATDCRSRRDGRTYVRVAISCYAYYPRLGDFGAR